MSSAAPSWFVGAMPTLDAELGVIVFNAISIQSAATGTGMAVRKAGGSQGASAAAAQVFGHCGEIAIRGEKPHVNIRVAIELWWRIAAAP
jgi:hypothetical protein